MLVAISKVAKTMPDIAANMAPAKPGRKSKKGKGSPLDDVMGLFNDPNTMEVLKNAGKMFETMMPKADL